MHGQKPFSTYIRHKILQLGILVLIECMAFTAIFAFSESNPMYIIELSSVKQVHGLFRYIGAVAAVIGFLGILILTKNLLEVIAASDEFIELERLATLGKFSAWTAHQIRNPLAVIKGQMQVLLLKQQDTYIQKACALIMRQADKMSDLLSLMMALSQPVLTHKEQVDVPRLVSDVLDTYTSTYPKIGFSRKGAVEGVVIGHAALLEEAVKNVITNAVESIDGAGAVDVVCSETPRNVTIEISDSGPGISDEAMQSAFEIGFTTKSRGTGLGLSIVKAIMNAHEGSVGIDRVRRSQAEHGTVVTLVLPKAEL